MQAIKVDTEFAGAAEEATSKVLIDLTISKKKSNVMPNEGDSNTSTPKNEGGIQGRSHLSSGDKDYSKVPQNNIVIDDLEEEESKVLEDC